jgi:hypothetical protein
VATYTIEPQPPAPQPASISDRATALERAAALSLVPGSPDVVVREDGARLAVFRRGERVLDAQEIRGLLRETRRQESLVSTVSGYYMLRERIPPARRNDVDLWVLEQGGQVIDVSGDLWYQLPLDVAIS